MKLLMSVNYAAEQLIRPLAAPVDLNDLIGRTLRVESAYIDPFTDDWWLSVDVSDPVDSIPLSLLELEPMQIEAELESEASDDRRRDC